MPISIYFLLFISFNWRNLKISSHNKVFLSYLFLLFISCYIVGISFATGGIYYTIIGVTRYFYVLIISLVVLITVNNEKAVNNLLHLYVICIAIGSLTLPLQLLTGPIGWFSESSMRSGLIRYSSLFGNVSAMGIVGGTGLIAALLLNYKNHFIKMIMIFSILIGMGMSLQRAGIANIVLATLIYFYFYDIKPSKKTMLLFGSISFIIFTILFLLNYEPTQIYTSFFLTALGLDSGVTETIVDYDPLSEQIYYRLVTNVSVHFEERLGIIKSLTGLGFSGLGGVLGQKGIFTHNDIFNIVSVGGILYLFGYIFIISFVALYLKKYIKISKKNKNKLLSNNLIVLLGAHLLFVLNLPMGSGNFIHPNHSILFWTTIGLLSGHYYNYFHTSKIYKG